MVTRAFARINSLAEFDARSCNRLFLTKISRYDIRCHHLPLGNGIVIFPARDVGREMPPVRTRACARERKRERERERVCARVGERDVRELRLHDRIKLKFSIAHARSR